MRHLLIPALLMVSACSTGGVSKVSSASEPSESNELIKQAWPYAQLAYNSYHPERATPPADGFPSIGRFEALGTWDNDDIGLAFDIYRDRIDVSEKAHVVVFRGTEGKPTPRNCDWKHGNFQLHQQERAVGFLHAWMEAKGVAAKDLTLVGHSLGGGIALHASYRLAGGGPHVFVFNSSPRFFAPRADPRGGDASIDPSRDRRHSIVARAEFLGAARYFGREANQTYLSIPCGRSLNPITRHSMRELAICLTDLAAQSSDSAEAKASMEWIDRTRMRGRDEEDAAFPPCGYRY